MKAAAFLGPKRRLLIFLALLGCYPLVLFGAKSAWDSTANRVADWLPEDFDETKRLFWFAQRFGSDEILMVSWPGCTLEDGRLSRLAARLVEPIQTPQGERPPLFRSVFTGPEVLQALTSPPLELSRQQAINRLRGWLVGADGRVTSAIALVSPAGTEDRAAAVDHVYRCAEECGIRPDELLVAGTTVDGVAIDRISLASLLELNVLSLAVCFLLTWVFLGAFRLAVIVFFSAVYCQQLAMASVYYTGAQMDSVLMMIASLGYVLVTSGAVHLVNYYVDAAKGDGMAGAPWRALRLALVPCALASATTAIGLVSLSVSKIVPIARFGLYGAWAVMAGLAIIFLWIPAALEQWPPRKWLARRAERETRSRRFGWRSVSDVVIGGRNAILAATLLLMVVTGWAVTNLRTTARLHDMLPSESRVIRDYAWLEENIGPLVPVEVVLVFPPDSAATVLDRYLLVDRVQRVVERVEDVGVVLSAATFGPAVPRSEERLFEKYARRALLRRNLQRHREDFVGTGFVRQGGEGELWRISVRAPAGGNVDYAALLGRIRRAVDPVLRTNGPVKGVRAVFCGGIPLIQKAQEQLLSDLIESFLLAFGLIALAMAALLRSPVAGALSMIPNLLPCVVVFGALGWMGAKIDIGAVMTASVALGVAVDGTLHFVTWYRRGVGRGLSRHEAVRQAYSRCATAMVQSSMICGLGLLVFAGSGFVPVHRFGWLMFTLLGAALFSDVVVTPAMLAGPLGRFFQPPQSGPWRTGP